MQKQTELSEIQGYSRKRARHQKMLREELDQLQQKLREVRQLEPYAQEGKVLMNGGIFICGSFEKDQDGYGVFAFKRGFHADVVELLGDFLMPLRPWTWRAYRLMQELKRHIKKTRLTAG